MASVYTRGRSRLNPSLSIHAVAPSADASTKASMPASPGTPFIGKVVASLTFACSHQPCSKLRFGCSLACNRSTTPDGARVTRARSSAPEKTPPASKVCTAAPASKSCRLSVQPSPAGRTCSLGILKTLPPAAALTSCKSYCQPAASRRSAALIAPSSNTKCSSPTCRSRSLTSPTISQLGCRLRG